MATAVLESLEKERDPNVPDSELSRTSQLRRRLLNGEALTMQDAGPDKKDQALLANVIRHMKNMGFKFQVAKVDNPSGRGKLQTYKLKNPEHVPTKVGAANQRSARPRVSSSTAADGTPKPKRSKVGVNIGDKFTVFMIEQTDKGLRVGFRDDNGGRFIGESIA